MAGDYDGPLCGDPTCESPSCRQEAIDAWHEAGERAAREYVRGYFRQLGVEVLGEAPGGES